MNCALGASCGLARERTWEYTALEKRLGVVPRQASFAYMHM